MNKKQSMDLRKDENLIREIIQSVNKNPLCRERTKEYAVEINVEVKKFGIEIDIQNQTMIDVLTEIAIRYLVSVGKYDECLAKLSEYKKCQENDHDVDGR